MDSSSQPPVQTSSASTAPPVQTFSFIAPPMQSAYEASFTPASVLHFAPTDVGRNLANMNVSNLQTSFVAAIHIASVDTIVPLSNTHQVISLKLTNTNYLYWWMYMKPNHLGQGVFQFVDGLLSCPPHVFAVDGTYL